MLAGRNDKRAELPPLPGSPLVRVRAFSLFGGVRVEDRLPRRNLLDVIRALLDVIRARSKPTGS